MWKLTLLLLLIATPLTDCCFATRQTSKATVVKQRVNKDRDDSDSGQSSASSANAAASAAIVAAGALGAASAGSGANITTNITSTALSLNDGGSGSTSDATTNSLLAALLASLGIAVDVADVDTRSRNRLCTPPITTSRAFAFTATPAHIVVIPENKLLLTCAGTSLPAGCTPKIFINKQPEGFHTNGVVKRAKRQIADIGTCSPCSPLDETCSSLCSVIFNCDKSGKLVLEGSGQQVESIFCGPSCPPGTSVELDALLPRTPVTLIPAKSGASLNNRFDRTHSLGSATRERPSFQWHDEESPAGAQQPGDPRAGISDREFHYAENPFQRRQAHHGVHSTELDSWEQQHDNDD